MNNRYDSLSTSITKKGNEIGVILSVIICCAYCVSVLVFNIGNMMIPHFLFLSWVVSLIFIDFRYLSKILSRQYFVFFYIFILYFFVASLPMYSIVTCINRVITMLELIAPMIMYELYSKCGKTPKVIIFITISGLAIVNMYLLRQNVSIEMGLKQHADEDGFINTAYHWVYSLSILEGLIVYIIRKMRGECFEHKFLITLFLLVMSAAIFIVVILSLYATAMILMLVSVVMALLYGRKKWLLKLASAGLLSLLLFTHFLPFVINVLDKITPESTMYAKRAIEIFDIVNGDVDVDNSSGGARLARTMISLETFAYHPITGLTPFTDDVIAEPPVIPGTKIGNHAEWVDDMGLYGIWAFFLFAFLWKYTKRLYKSLDIAFIFIAFIILGFLNKCFYIVHMTLLFLYAPIMYDYIMSLKKSNKR